MNEIPLFWQIVLALGGLIGVREIVVRSWEHFLGKRKATAQLGILSEEQRQLHLTNEGTKLDQMAEITKRMEDLIARAEELGTANSELRQRVRDEERRVDRRDAVIEYQKGEIADLHEAVTQVREQMAVLRDKFETLSAAHVQTTQANMRLQATVDELEAKWKEVPGQSGS